MENSNDRSDSSSHAPSKNLKNKRPLIFLGVGIVNTLLDFAFYTLLTQTAFNDPKQIGLAGLVSGTFSLICAFLTHSFITWRGSHINHKTIVKFFMFTGCGMWVLRPLLLSIFIRFSGLYNWAYSVNISLGLHFNHSFITNTGAFGLMIIVILVYNYILYEHFVFKK